MNDLVKQLAEQAQIQMCSDARLQEFAELIVKECCQKLENDGMVEVAIEIKQHFELE